MDKCAKKKLLLFSFSRWGFRASNGEPGDGEPGDGIKEWRFNWIPFELDPILKYHVWVAPGVKCRQPCKYQFSPSPCQEVSFAKQCDLLSILG